MNYLFKNFIFKNIRFFNEKIILILLASLFINSNGLQAKFKARLDINPKLLNKEISITSMNKSCSQYNHRFNFSKYSERYYKENPSNFHSNKFYTYATLENGNNGFYYNAKNDKTDNINKREIPPLNLLRISGELVAGVGAGYVAGIGLGVTGVTLAFAAGAPAEFSTMGYGFLGFIIGYPIGNTIGVYLIGNLGDETGEFWNTLLGSIIGGIGGFYFIATTTEYLPYIVLSPIGATIGFNLSRRYEQSRNSNALLNIKNNKLSMNWPDTYYKYSAGGRGEITVDLIKYSF